MALAWIGTGLLVPVGIGVALLFQRRLGARAQLLAWVGTAAVMILAWGVLAEPAMNDQKSYRPIAEEMRALAAPGARFLTYGFDSEALRLYFPGIRGLRTPQAFRDAAAAGPFVVLVEERDWGEIEGAARRERDVTLGRNRFVLGVGAGPDR
jgi:hypothetical protein